MHESTISRVTTNKYVQTPQGLFELKYFFTSGISTESGGVRSSESVKLMIKDMEIQDSGGLSLKLCCIVSVSLQQMAKDGLQSLLPIN